MGQYIDYAKLKERVTIEQIVEHYGWDLQGNGNQLVGDCPVCGNNISDSTRFKVTPSKGAWKCFADCDGGGNMIDLVARVEGVKLTEAARRIATWFNVTDCELEQGITRKAQSKPSAKAELASNEHSDETADVHVLPVASSFSLSVMTFREACQKIKHDSLDPNFLRVIDVREFSVTPASYDAVEDVVNEQSST